MADPNDIRSQAFFTIKELAERWRCSQKTIRRRIHDGDLAAHFLNGMWLMSAADVAAAEALARRPARL